MQIAIIHNQPEERPADGDWLARSSGNPSGVNARLHEAAEFGVLGEVELVQTSLTQAGHESKIVAADSVAGLCDFLSKNHSDLIFNCCEAFAGRAALEMNVAALYELFGFAYTGSSALTLGLLLNKALAKDIFRAHGILTPAHIVVGSGQDLSNVHHLTFPLIVKPVAEDASIGIDDGAVVNDEVALVERVRFVWREFCQAALVEEFIVGREFSASLLAISPSDFTVLAISEITFDLFPAGTPHILGYQAKWDPAAPVTQSTATRCPAQIDDKTADRIRRVSLDVAQAVGLRDYGRVDLRLRESDQALFVLEANPNPDLSDGCAFMQAARTSGRSNQGTICEIVERAVERFGRQHKIGCSVTEMSHE